jgi:hypothetical protein
MPTASPATMARWAMPRGSRATRAMLGVGTRGKRRSFRVTLALNSLTSLLCAFRAVPHDRGGQLCAGYAVKGREATPGRARH